MTRREELRERYEEALFALLMDEVARSEGEALLRREETPALLPQRGERTCLEAIHRSVRRRQVRRVGRASRRALGKAVMAAGLAASLFVSAFALSEDVRAGTMNMMISVSKSGTVFSLGNTGNAPGSLTFLTPKWLPKGFFVTDSDTSKMESWVHYERSENEFIEFTCIQAEGTVLDIDTENAKVEMIQINGQQATLVEKDTSIQLVYLTADQSYFIQVLSERISREDFLRCVEGLT